jgi:hypothetical protein
MKENGKDAETIKRRVKKLLALSKSPNENEAVAALEKAQTLMDEYRLTEGECLYARERVPATKRLSRWRAVLSGAVAWLYCCARYRSTVTGEIVFYGDSFDAFMAGEMYRYLAKTVDRMARQNIRKNASMKYREKYRLGIACRLAVRIEESGLAAAWADARGSRLRTVLSAARRQGAAYRSTARQPGAAGGFWRRKSLSRGKRQREKRTAPRNVSRRNCFKEQLYERKRNRAN